jgi:four helix bundle protein
MSEQSDQLKHRTMVFAVATLRLIDSLPPSNAAQTIARQLAKSSTSVGANYRAGCNARSRAEFVAKLCIVVEEADESEFWLDLIARIGAVPGSKVAALRQEAVELCAIFSRSVATARRNLRASRTEQKGLPQ